MKTLPYKPGDRFGKLTIKSRIGTDLYGHSLWKCKCDCGNTTVVRGFCLGIMTNSCGCLRNKRPEHKYTCRYCGFVGTTKATVRFICDNQECIDKYRREKNAERPRNKPKPKKKPKTKMQNPENACIICGHDKGANAQLCKTCLRRQTKEVIGIGEDVYV